jgi:hypothetical protein
MQPLQPLSRPTLVGSVAVAHPQGHGRAYHEGHVCGLLCLQTAYARRLFRAFVTYPTESVVARFG